MTPSAVPVPERLAKLPRSPKPPNYIVPFFVQWFDGVPDFRIMNPQVMGACIHHRLCWLCGEPIEELMTFVIGPMCTVNRVSAEPPSHKECAEYAVQVCPFMLNPNMRRNEKDLDKIPKLKAPGGEMILRNPGVNALWTCEDYTLFESNGGILFEIATPYVVDWWTQGRKANHQEVIEAFKTGLPQLAALAIKDGPLAELELRSMVKLALQYVPREEKSDAGSELATATI